MLLETAEAVKAAVEAAPGITTSALNLVLKGIIIAAVGAIGPGIGIGLIGAGACQAVGRNPGAFGRIFLVMILSIAFTAALFIICLVFALK